jgi:GDP/UDP-N,N'-diacetylbacillosamine 2-epimerase (hydrolysing)
MALGIAKVIEGCTKALKSYRPDILLLLGDRGEMLAGAIAAIHLNIPVAHIHGGERSGTVDEAVRHAISKLSHIHLAATSGSAQRLKNMGEREDVIFTVGAPGLSQVDILPEHSAAKLFEKEGFDGAKKTALLVFHPVVQEAGSGPAQLQSVLDALDQHDCQTVALRPNGDFGGKDINAALNQHVRPGHFNVKTHLPREEFLGWMAAADVMLGNSSSGIIEAASFGIPVINIGSRQNLRERNANVTDVAAETAPISKALKAALAGPKFAAANIYGDGQSAMRICEILENVELTPDLLAKANTY